MTQPQEKMSRIRTALNAKINCLEDVYKILFLGVDRIVYHVIVAATPSEVLNFTLSGNGPKWAEPMTFARAVEIGTDVYTHMIQSAYLQVVTLLETYLRVMCEKALIIRPEDSTWFSFWNLDVLSRIQDLSGISRYNVIEAAFKFRDGDLTSEFIRLPNMVNHDSLLRCFEAARLFAEDFERAFMIANGHVKESEI